MSIITNEYFEGLMSYKQLFTLSLPTQICWSYSLAPVCGVESTREGNRFYDYCLQFLYSFKKFSSSALKSSLSSSECSPRLSTAILSDSSVEEVDVCSGNVESESIRINSAGATALSASWVVLSSISITMGLAVEPEVSWDLSTASIKYLWP